ncbi:uncharacterized mitochondrial protein-like protein [Tanacetum coccineum]
MLISDSNILSASSMDHRDESGNPTEGKYSEVSSTEEPIINQEKDDNINSTNNINTASDGNNTNNVNAVSSTVNAASSEVNAVDPKTSIELPNPLKTSSALEASWKFLFLIIMYLLGKYYLTHINTVSPTVNAAGIEVNAINKIEMYVLVQDTNDYAGASLDRKSTTEGCQFLGCRLISWQCKKQTVVANSTTEAEYIAASNCCRQML